MNKFILFLILIGFGGLFQSECKAQDFSIGVLTEFSENKFIPSIFLVKKIRKKNFFQLSFSAGKFSDGYYPGQLSPGGREPLFRERNWELPYPDLGLTTYPSSNYVKIIGVRFQIGYLEYFPLDNKKHKLFWNINANFNLLNDQFIASDSTKTVEGEFNFISIGTNIRFGYRFILEKFHFTAFVGPTQYIDLYPGNDNPSSTYPFVAPFVDLEMEGGLSVGYSFFK